MIVRMKEILLFTSASDVEDTVQKLGEIGVVDIKEVVTPSNDDVLRCQKNLEAAQKT